MNPSSSATPVNGTAAPALGGTLRNGVLRPARDLKGIAFCWLEKRVLNRVAEHYGEAAKQTASARSVLLAMAELASDAGASSFEARVALIAYRAGLSIRTVRTILLELELAGVLRIVRRTVEGSKLDAPSRYELLTLCNDYTPPCNGCTPPCNKSDSLVAERVKEQGKNSKELLSTEEQNNGAVRASKPPKVERNNLPVPPLALSDQTDFPPAWAEFQAHRAELKKPLTPTAAKRLLATLAERPAQAAAALAMAVERGWRGFAWEWFDRGRTPCPSVSRPGTPARPASRPSEQRTYADREI